MEKVSKILSAPLGKIVLGAEQSLQIAAADPSLQRRRKSLFPIAVRYHDEGFHAGKVAPRIHETGKFQIPDRRLLAESFSPFIHLRPAGQFLGVQLERLGGGNACGHKAEFESLFFDDPGERQRTS